MTAADAIPVDVDAEVDSCVVQMEQNPNAQPRRNSISVADLCRINLTGSSRNSASTPRRNSSVSMNGPRPNCDIDTGPFSVQKSSCCDRRGSVDLAVQYQTASVETRESIYAAESGRRPLPRGKIAETVAALDFHLLSVDETFARFGTRKSFGLDELDAARRRERYGTNTLTAPAPKLWRKVVECFCGGFCGILWFAAGMCLLAWKPLGQPADPMNLAMAVLLLAVIALQAGFTAYQSWQTSCIMDSINGMLATTAQYYRDGILVEGCAEELVIGDLVQLKSGCSVPADLRLVKCSRDLQFDRSILTGEMDPVGGLTAMTDRSYMETKNIALMGTNVVNGTGLGVVVSIGDGTIMGKIADMTTGNKVERTLLQKEIDRFVWIVVSCALVAATLLMVVWGAWLERVYPNFMNLSQALVNATAVLVAFIPEGLPIAVTITLSLIAKRMASKSVLVKNLTTVETLGAVDVILSDKTGTLTQNKMTVIQAGTLQGQHTVEELRQLVSTKPLSRDVQELVSASILCNGATFASSFDSPNTPPADRQVIGDATDTGVFLFGAQFANVESVRSRHTKLFEVPFNSRNKWMLAIFQPDQPDLSDASAFMLVKGAPDILLPRCAYAMDESGRPTPMLPSVRQSIAQLQEKWSNCGQRVIIVCKRQLTDELLDSALNNSSGTTVGNDKLDDDQLGRQLVQSLCFVGMLALMDPPKPEIKSVVETCRRAGIRLMMVTGDFKGTATAIARSIGLVSSAKVDSWQDVVAVTSSTPVVGPTIVIDNCTGDSKKQRALVLTGQDLDRLDEMAWYRVTQYQEIVFARTTPEQKLRIVQEFRRCKHVVAVTGDGVNDAPALKAAHVGIAMGSGSDVALEASPMVLLDNNFSAIPFAIENGRQVFENIQSVITYLLPAGCVAELAPIFVNIFLGVPLPISSFLMLCICMATDMFPSMALMYERPAGDIMLRKPRKQTDTLLPMRSVVKVVVIGAIEAACAHLMFFYYLNTFGNISAAQLLFSYDKFTDGFQGKSEQVLGELVATAQTVYFLTLVICQCGNLVGSLSRGQADIVPQLLAATRGKESRVAVARSYVADIWHRNRHIFLAMAASLTFALVVTLVPYFNVTFGTRPVPVQFILGPFLFAAGIALIGRHL